MSTKTSVWLVGFLLVASVGLHVRSRVQANPPLYVVPKYQAQFSSVEDLLSQMVLELRAVREELGQIRLQLGNQPLAVTEQGETLFRSRCTSCHTAEVAEAKGGSTILIDEQGSLAPMRYQVRTIRKQLEKDLMPMAGDKFSPAEKQLAFSFLESLKGGR